MKTIKKIFVVLGLIMTSITLSQSYEFKYNTIEVVYENQSPEIKLASKVNGLIVINNSFSEIIIIELNSKGDKSLKYVNDIEIKKNDNIEIKLANYIDKVSDDLYTILLKVDVVNKEIHYLVLKKQTENFSLLFINE